MRAYHRDDQKSKRRCRTALLTLLAVMGVLEIQPVPASGEDAVASAEKPQAADRANLAKLPDWGGIWTPELVRSGGSPFGMTDPPWTPDAARQIAALKADAREGHPHTLFINCLPEGMPSYIMMTLNALEFLVTPGRVTILGEFDGNRLRRIYTDGRSHPPDPDLTFNGHSIGHWEGGTLVVDTVAVLPETFLPLGQGGGLPNNGDMHIVEHIRLTDPDRLVDELEITAPHQLTAPWKTSRRFIRHRDHKSDIVEASCRQGDFVEGKDADGNAVFLPATWKSSLKGTGRPVLTAWLVLCSATTSAVAHHSFAMYDTTQTVTIDGTVKDFQWTNPHALLWIVERSKDGAPPQEWAIELPTSPGNLSRLGWSKHSLNPGDDIVLEMSPLRDGKHGGSFKKATFEATGQVLQVIVDPAKSDDKRADK